MIRFEEFGGNVTFVNPRQVLRVRGKVERWTSIEPDGKRVPQQRMDTYIDLYGTPSPVYLHERDPAEVAAIIATRLDELNAR